MLIISIINRLGGKYHLRKKINSMIPDHKTYIEPFFGAGWVYFYKEKSKVEVINDKDSELVNMFRVIRDHEPELSRLIGFEVNSRNRFENLLSAKQDSLTDIQRALRYLYLVSFSFGAKGSHYGYSKSRPNSLKFFDEGLREALSNRLAGAYIENLDYSSIIKKYDSESSFFFIDPPYLDTCMDFSPSTKVTFSRENFDNLKLQLQELKGKFILTVNDHDYLRELFDEFKIEEIEVPYSICKSNKLTAKELIISNY